MKTAQEKKQTDCTKYSDRISLKRLHNDMHRWRQVGGNGKFGKRRLSDRKLWYTGDRGARGGRAEAASFPTTSISDEGHNVVIVDRSIKYSPK